MHDDDTLTAAPTAIVVECHELGGGLELHRTTRGDVRLVNATDEDDIRFFEQSPAQLARTARLINEQLAKAARHRAGRPLDGPPNWLKQLRDLVAVKRRPVT